MATIFKYWASQANYGPQSYHSNLGWNNGKGFPDRIVSPTGIMPAYNHFRGIKKLNDARVAVI